MRGDSERLGDPPSRPIGATRGLLTRDVELSVSTDWQRILPPEAFFAYIEDT